MKQKVLNEINDFVSLCYTAFKLGAGDFAKENFPTIVENFWDGEKSDKENLETVKQMFETNKKLNEINGSKEAAKVIEVFQEGWLNKLEV